VHYLGDPTTAGDAWPWERGRGGEYVWLIIYAVDKEVNNKPPTWRPVNGRHYAALVPLPRLDCGAATRTILLLLVFAAKYTAVGRRRQRPCALLRSTGQTDDRRLTIQNRCTADEMLQFFLNVCNASLHRRVTSIRSRLTDRPRHWFYAPSVLNAFNCHYTEYDDAMKLMLRHISPPSPSVLVNRLSFPKAVSGLELLQPRPHAGYWSE